MASAEPPTYASSTSPGGDGSDHDDQDDDNRAPSATGNDGPPSLLLAPLPSSVSFLAGSLGLSSRGASIQGDLLLKGDTSRAQSLQVSLVLTACTPTSPTPYVLFSTSHFLWPPQSTTTSGEEGKGEADPRPPLIPRQRFSIPIPTSLPQCVHQPSIALGYTLTASLVLTPPPSSSAAATASMTAEDISANTQPPLPAGGETIRESMEIHLCPAGIAEDDADGRPDLQQVIHPIARLPLKIGFPKLRVRKSETLGIWVEIPVPDTSAVEQGVGLRNVRAELRRVVRVCSRETEKPGVHAIGPSSSSASPSSAGAVATSQSDRSSSTTLLTTTGASCRFSPISPIRLRLSLHPPLSPSSPYQLTCGHLTQSTRRLSMTNEWIETRFWLRVVIGLVGPGVEEVHVEREVEVLGDLDPHPLLSESASVSTPSSFVTPSTSTVAPRAWTKEERDRWEGETIREGQGSGSHPTARHAIDAGPAPPPSPDPEEPPPFVARDPFPTIRGGLGVGPPAPLSPLASPPSLVAHHQAQPPPFSELPPPPHASDTLPHPSAPPPTFFESEAASVSPYMPPSHRSDLPRPFVLGPPLLPLPATSAAGDLAPSLSILPSHLRSPPLHSTPSPPDGLPAPPPPPPPAIDQDPARLPPDWQEYDGYETFSDPPPPVSVAFASTSSVDPPPEGEPPSVITAERMENLLHELTIGSGGSGPSAVPEGGRLRRDGSEEDGGGPQQRVDDPNDPPPTFGTGDPPPPIFDEASLLSVPLSPSRRMGVTAATAAVRRGSRAGSLGGGIVSSKMLPPSDGGGESSGRLLAGAPPPSYAGAARAREGGMGAGGSAPVAGSGRGTNEAPGLGQDDGEDEEEDMEEELGSVEEPPRYS